MKLDELHPGTKLAYWFDTGALGAQLVYCEVVKLGRRKVKVRDEYGNEAWKYPHFFDQIVSEETWREIFPAS